jgi:hypothetical protein
MGLCRSDHEREIVKGRGDGHSGKCIYPEFVMSSTQVLDEAMGPDCNARGPVPFQAERLYVLFIIELDIRKV